MESTGILKKKMGRMVTLTSVMTLILSMVSIPAYAVEKTGAEMVAEVIETLDLKGESYYNKIEVINAWVSGNITYDYAARANIYDNSLGTPAEQDVKTVMTSRKAVCEGYAEVFKQFMDQIGAPSLIVSDAVANHAYNLVLFQDYKWYMYDPTNIRPSAERERPHWERVIREAEERKADAESRIGQSGWDDGEQTYNTSLAEKDINDAKEHLKSVVGAGEYMFFGSGMNALADSWGRYKNFWVQYHQLEGELLYGYPLAAESKSYEATDWKDAPFVWPSSVPRSLRHLESVLAPIVPIAIMAVPSTAKILINGKKISFEAYTINDNNYFKLRDVAQELSGTNKQFNVSWNNAKGAIELFSGKAYIPVGGELLSGDPMIKTATPGTSAIYKDGSSVTPTAYTINENNYFKLRDLGQAFDFNVSWDGENNAIVIDTASSYTAD